MAKYLISLLIVIAIGLSSPQPVTADVNICRVFGQGTATAGNFCGYTQITQLLNPLIWNFYILVGFGVLAVLFYGGFQYIMGAGQGDGKRIEQGKEALTWGLAGLITVVASFWIILIVQVITGLDIVGGGGL